MRHVKILTKWALNNRADIFAYCGADYCTSGQDIAHCPTVSTDICGYDGVDGSCTLGAVDICRSMDYGGCSGAFYTDECEANDYTYCESANDSCPNSSDYCSEVLAPDCEEDEYFCQLGG